MSKKLYTFVLPKTKDMTPINQTNFAFTKENGNLILIYETNGKKVYMYNAGEYNLGKRNYFESWICGSQKALWELAKLIRELGQRIN